MEQPESHGGVQEDMDVPLLRSAAYWAAPHARKGVVVPQAGLEPATPGPCSPRSLANWATVAGCRSLPAVTSGMVAVEVAVHRAMLTLHYHPYIVSAVLSVRPPQ